LPENERAEVMRVLAMPRERKRENDVARIAALVKATESIDYARRIAARAAEKAARIFSTTRAWIPPSVHRSFFEGLVEYVVQRER
jgi:geranylgeranyl pyrophosphate synthase